MSKPSVIRSVGNRKENNAVPLSIQEVRGRFEAETLADLTAQARARIEVHAARVLVQSGADAEMEQVAQIEVKCRDEAGLNGKIQTKLEAAKLATADAAEACIFAEILALKESEARLIAYREAEQATLARAAAERTAAELLRSQAEADRNATQLQEQANVLLRKAEKKAQERLATETMASKAAAFRLQTERDLAILAEQRATAELHAAREVELRLRAEKKEMGMTEAHMVTE